MELLKIADTVFLALMIWREARGASKEVKTGIAAVILNRVKTRAWFGKDITEVANANSYYDISISAPKWATKTSFVKQIDNVRFYKV